MMKSVALLSWLALAVSVQGGGVGDTCEIKYQETGAGMKYQFSGNLASCDAGLTCTVENDPNSPGIFEGTCAPEACAGLVDPELPDDIAENEATARVTICHRTCSTTNPWVRLTIDNDAWVDDDGTCGGHKLQHHVYDECAQTIRNNQGEGETFNQTMQRIWGEHDSDYLVKYHGTRDAVRQYMGWEITNGNKRSKDEKDYWMNWERACPYVRNGQCCGTPELGPCCGDIPYPAIEPEVQPESTPEPSNEKEREFHIGCSTGDPHITTFDGLKYDCQSEGEHILATSRSGNCTRQVQMRYQHISTNRALSSAKAIAIRDDGDHLPVIQLSIPALDDSVGTDMGDSDGCKLQLFVNGKQRFLLEGSGVDHLVTVEYTPEKKDIWVKFVESGFKVKVRYNQCMINACVHWPSDDPVVGILGTATSDVNDDWTAKDGVTQLPVPTAYSDRLRKPAYDFCTKQWCNQDPEDSLFVYPEAQDGYDFEYYNKCELPYGNTIEQFIEEVPQSVVNICEGDFTCIMDVMETGDEGSVLESRQMLQEYSAQCNPVGGECELSPCCAGAECVDQGGYAGKVCMALGETPACAPEYGNCLALGCCDGLACTDLGDGMPPMCMDASECRAEYTTCSDQNDCCDDMLCMNNPKGGKHCRKLHQCMEKYDDCSLVSCCGDLQCLDDGFGGKQCKEVPECHSTEGKDCSSVPCCDCLTCVEQRGANICKSVAEFVGVGESCKYSPCDQNWKYPLVCADTVDIFGNKDRICQIKPGDVELTVFDDINSNGIQDDGELGVPGVKVRLVRAEDGTLFKNNGKGGSVHMELVSDFQGKVHFTQVPRALALRAVVVRQPPGAIRTINNAGDDDSVDSDLLDEGVTNPFKLASEQMWKHTALGYRMPTTLRVKVFKDNNENGIQDEDESGIKGVSIRLVDAKNGHHLEDLSNGGNAHEELVTDSEGFAVFTKVPQSVQLRAVVTNPPPGAIPTLSNVGEDDTRDSDLRVDGTTFSFQIKKGTDHNTLDLGYRMPETVKVTAWNDANNNGIIDNGETGIANTTVRLVYADNLAALENFNNDGNAHEELSTDEDGIVLFTKVPRGVQLRVQVTSPPNGAVYSQVNWEAMSDLRSDDTSTSFTVGKSGSEVQLGYNLPQTLVIRVWDDRNFDGLQGPEEKGIEGVKLRLIDDSTGEYLPQSEAGNSHLELVSDKEGFVSFSNVPLGTYLRAIVTNAPKGATRTIHNVGDDSSKDSDLETNERSDRFIMSTGAMTEIDLGYQMPRDVSVRVWDDNNRNSVQDPDELGVEGVRLRLLKEENSTFYEVACSSTGEAVNSLFEDSDAEADSGSLCAYEVTTDSSGVATFVDIPQGIDLRVKVMNPPKGVQRVVQGSGSDGLLDSDLGDDGLSRVFNLARFVEDTFNEIALGYMMPEDVRVRVFNDNNGNGIQDANDNGIEGVNLRLIYARDGSPIESSDGTAHTELVTDLDGFVTFTKVPVGDDIRVQVTNAPEGAVGTLFGQGNEEGADSDLRSDGTTTSFNLRSFTGDIFDSIDIGFRMPPDVEVRVWDDVNGNGIQDEGEGGIQGVQLRLIDAAHHENIENPGSGSTAHLPITTNADGIATFSKVPRDLHLRVKVINAPPGSIRTQHNKGSDDAADSDLRSDMTTFSFKLNKFDDPVFDHVDIGFKMPKTVVVRTWNDLNRNGIQDEDEVGIPGVELFLIDDKSRERLGDQGNGGNCHLVVTSDALGRATFTKVPQGVRLRIRVQSAPEGGTVTTRNAGSDNHLDSDMWASGTSDSFQLPSDVSELYDEMDVGYYFDEEGSPSARRKLRGI